MAGIAAVDSLNPASIAPALVFAVSSRPVARVLQFGLAMLLVNVAGGLLLVVGPGQLLFDLIPHPGAELKHVLEVVGGAALLIGAAVLLLLRRRIVEREKAGEAEKEAKARSGSAFVAGAGIALAELPTAFPYFAAIAALEAANVPVVWEVVGIVLFNVIFLAPVFLIALIVGLFPSLRQTLIEPVRGWMTQHWPQVLAGLLAVAGIGLLAVGIAGLSG